MKVVAHLVDENGAWFVNLRSLLQTSPLRSASLREQTPEPRVLFSNLTLPSLFLASAEKTLEVPNSIPHWEHLCSSFCLKLIGGFWSGGEGIRSRAFGSGFVEVRR